MLSARGRLLVRTGYGIAIPRRSFSDPQPRSRHQPRTLGLRGKPGPAVHDDRVKRKFTTTSANTLWLTDSTEHRTDESKLYPCAINDVWSNWIVGYSIDSNMNATLAVRALHSAIRTRPHLGCVLHSDRGSQFRAKKFVRVLTNNGLLGSMGRVGACADKAAWKAPIVNAVSDDCIFAVELRASHGRTVVNID